VSPSNDPTTDPTRFRLPRASVGLSVALCTYNGERWLPELLDSLAAQELIPDELVISDDASTDGSVGVAHEFAATAPFEVRIGVNPTRVGSTANFALALERCRGHFIALADQDDIWYPTKLRRLQRELAGDPTVTLVFSDADLIDERGGPLGERLWQTRLVDHTLRHHAVVSGKMFAQRPLTTGCTMMVRRRAVEAAIPFPHELADPAAPMRHDRWLSLLAAAVGTVRAIPEPMLGFRLHPEQETGVLVGRELLRALATAAGDVIRQSADSQTSVHHARAAQLDVAAERADLLGDFEGADMLRSVADQHRRRTLDAPTVRGRLQLVAEGMGDGTYGNGALGTGAALADLVRATKSWTTSWVP